MKTQGDDPAWKIWLMSALLASGVAALFYFVATSEQLPGVPITIALLLTWYFYGTEQKQRRKLRRPDDPAWEIWLMSALLASGVAALFHLAATSEALLGVTITIAILLTPYFYWCESERVRKLKRPSEIARKAAQARWAKKQAKEA